MFSAMCADLIRSNNTCLETIELKLQHGTRIFKWTHVNELMEITQRCEWDSHDLASVPTFYRWRRTVNSLCLHSSILCCIKNAGVSCRVTTNTFTITFSNITPLQEAQFMLWMPTSFILFGHTPPLIIYPTIQTGHDNIGVRIMLVKWSCRSLLISV